MSSLSSSSTNHEIFLYDKAEEEAVNGFVAGLAGSALHDEADLHLSGVTSNKRTIRLSANSGSYEESDYRISHPSITEELTSDLDSQYGTRLNDQDSQYETRLNDQDSQYETRLNDQDSQYETRLNDQDSQYETRLNDQDSQYGTRLNDQDSQYEMRVSEGSHYPSRFSLLNLSDVTKEDSETTLEVTNCSTIDVTLDHNSLEISVDKEEEEEAGSEREGDSVFSPVTSSSFGEFQKRKDSRHGSDSSMDSFGDFDDGPWVSPAGTSVEVTSPHVMTSPHLVVSRDEVVLTTDQCYEPSSPTSLILHSSPKKLLDSNFVWVQARSNVTKPSYMWDKLKLHSYLLGALSVRQPISLNRLKPAGSVTPKKITSSCGSGSLVSSIASSSHSSSPSSHSSLGTVSTSSPDSPVSSTSLSCSVSPCVVELGELPAASGSLSEVGWHSNVSSPDIPNVCSEPNSRPSLTTLIHRKLTSHRRTHSSPIPVVKPASPGTRSLSNSPSTAVRGMAKCSSLESPLSPSSFDETHAGRGLSLMQLGDIQTMRHEMKSRVSELSATLITEFQYRGDADHSKEVKKAFVSAFLTAEEKKSKGQLSNRQKSLLPIVCNEHCPPTEILVLLTQLLNGLINDTPHTAELLKHYMYMLCRPCLDN